MFLGGGASLTLAGGKWLGWWNPECKSPKSEKEANFRYGDGSLMPNLGTIVSNITFPPKIANAEKAIGSQLGIHEVQGNVPLLISRESLSRLEATLGFRG